MPKRITKGNLWGFIQSRPYASVADIRRTFTMDVADAAVVPTTEGTYFIGLPQDAADLVRQLWHEGRIVLDTNPDVKALVVQGVYPARAQFTRQHQPGGQGGPSFHGGQGSQGAPGGQRRRQGGQPPDGRGNRAAGGLGAPAQGAGRAEPGVAAVPGDGGDARQMPGANGGGQRLPVLAAGGAEEDGAEELYEGLEAEGSPEAGDPKQGKRRRRRRGRGGAGSGIGGGEPGEAGDEDGGAGPAVTRDSGPAGYAVTA